MNLAELKSKNPVVPLQTGGLDKTLAADKPVSDIHQAGQDTWGGDTTAPAHACSYNYSRDLFGMNTKSAADVLASGQVNTDPAHKNLDDLAVGRLASMESMGETKTSLDMGTVVISPTEVLDMNLNVGLIPNQETHRYDVSFTPQVNRSFVHGVETDTSEARTAGFTIFDGTGPTSRGTFTETIPDDPGIPANDIVSKNQDGVVVKRQWRELWVMGEVNDGEKPSYVSERLFLKLDPRGNPVVEKNHFSGTVDPEQLADAMPAQADGKKLGAEDLQSGIFIDQSRESTRQTIAIQGDSGSNNGTSVDDKTGRREFAAQVGSRFMGGPALSLGWSKDPTNNSTSWYTNRTDFSATLNEVMADERIGGHKMDPQTVADLQKRTIEALGNADDVGVAVPGRLVPTWQGAARFANCGSRFG